MRGALALSLALVAAFPTLASGARTISFPEWFAIRADFAGRTLVWSEAATVRLDPSKGGRDLPAGLRPFVYYRIHTSTAPLDRARRGFVGGPEQHVTLRTQIARMTSGRVAGDGDGRFVIVPGARRFAAPVVFCCTADVETVVVSDGREDAPRPLSATLDGGIVRALLRDRAGGITLVSADPTQRVPELHSAPFPGSATDGLAGLAEGTVAWVDPDTPGTLSFGVPSDGGVVGRRSVRLPGRARRLWVDRGVAVAAVARSRRIALVRVDLTTPRPTIVWQGSRLPHVAIGEGAVVAAEGSSVFAARAGRLRRITRARGQIAAVAASGRRIAWFERVRRKGERRTVVRIARIS